jgi:hypothetical protein
MGLDLWRPWRGGGGGGKSGEPAVRGGGAAGRARPRRGVTPVLGSGEEGSSSELARDSYGVRAERGVGEGP